MTNAKRPRRRMPTRYLGPLVPKTWTQANAWMRLRDVLKIGFTTALHRLGDGRIEVRSGTLRRCCYDPD